MIRSRNALGANRRLVSLLVAVCAAALLLASCGGQPKPADLFFRAPAVSYMTTDGQPHTLDALHQVALGVNDQVTVADAGEGRLLFGDSLEVRIFRSSELAFEGTVAESATQLQRMRLTAGTTFATLNAQQAAAARLQIDTKWARIVALGTAFLVHYDPVREITWVVVREGQVSVTANGREIIVGAGQQTWIEPGVSPVGPLLACREVVGDRFPYVEELTFYGMTDIELLPCPGQASPKVVVPTKPPEPAPVPTTELQAVRPVPVKPPPAPQLPPVVKIIEQIVLGQGAVPAGPAPSLACEKLAITGPSDGSTFTGPRAEVRLSWTPVGRLAEDAYYRVLTDFPHQSETWQDYQYTKDTYFVLPAYLNEIATGNRQLRWRVGVVVRNAPDRLEDDVNLCQDTPQQTVVWEAAPPPDQPTASPSATVAYDRLPTFGQWWRLALILGSGMLLGLWFVRDEWNKL